MKIETNKENNSVLVINDEVKAEVKIKNLMAWDRHSFPRWAMVDANTGKVLASLSGGGSYGWIIHTKDESKRWLLLKVAREAQKAKLGWPWTNVQC